MRRSLPRSRPVLALAAAALVAAAAHAAPEQYLARQRQPRLVSSSPTEVVLEDFRWGHVDQGGPALEPSFQRTTLRPDRVAEVYWYSELFPPKWIAAHGQLVFLMKDTDGVVGADGQRDIGFVMSFEARFKKGQEYSPLGGMRPGKYGSIVLMTSLADRIQRSALFYGHSMHTFRMKLDEQQKRAAVLAAVRFATKDRSDESYHTTRNSCITAAVDVLNEVLPKRKRIRKWTIPGVLHNLRVSLPKWMPLYLLSHGLAERTEKWDQDVRVLRWPTERGVDHVLDVRALPGSPIPRELLAFEEALFQFRMRTDSLRGLVKLQSLIPIHDPRFFKFQAEIGPAEDHLYESLEAAVELAAASPVAALRLYLKRRPAPGEETQALEKALRQRLQGLLTAGQADDAEGLRAALAEMAKPRQ